MKKIFNKQINKNLIFTASDKQNLNCNRFLIILQDIPQPWSHLLRPRFSIFPTPPFNPATAHPENNRSIQELVHSTSLSQYFGCK
jgi:hypothetical protein